MADPARAKPAFDIIALAASAGGLRALSELLAGVQEGLPVAWVVVQHMDPHHSSHLAEILGRRTPLQVCQANDGDRLVAGTVFIAPPDRHLLVRPGGTLALTDSARVHYVRPSADLLLESMAASFADRAIAVILSGTGRDGSLGVKAVKDAGGTVIAQDPLTAEYDGMPRAAVQTGQVDLVLPLEGIAPALIRLVSSGDEHEPAGG